MTNKEFFTKVITLASNDKEIVKFCEKALASLEAKNEKAKVKRMEAQASNAPLLKGIVDYLTAHPTALGNELAQALGVSTPKATAMASKLVESGVISKREVSIPKVGKRMAYSLVKSE